MKNDSCDLYLRYLESSFCTACALSLSAKSTRMRSLNICNASLFLPKQQIFHIYKYKYMYIVVIASATWIDLKQMYN